MQSRKRFLTGAFLILILAGTAIVAFDYKNPWAQQTIAPPAAAATKGATQSANAHQAEQLKAMVPTRTKPVTHFQPTYEVAATFPDVIVAESKYSAEARIDGIVDDAAFCRYRNSGGFDQARAQTACSGCTR